MSQIRLKISDLFEIEPQTIDRPENFAAITAYVLKHYAFLPQPIAVTVEDDEVLISYPEEADTKREEAARLAARAMKHASEGNYKRAIGIYKRVLELQPSFHSARRDLAMAYMEIGDVENATNHLIEVLRLDPKDAWSWVVLGNLYVREKGDPETGEKFLRKALELKPDDAWALNSLAAGYQKKGQNHEAIEYFDKATEANPQFANRDLNPFPVAKQFGPFLSNEEGAVWTQSAEEEPELEDNIITREIYLLPPNGRFIIGSKDRDAVVVVTRTI